MWESGGLQNEDFLWAGTAFNGGIGGNQQAPCGAVSAATVYLGLSYRCSSADKQRAKQARAEARQDASNLVTSFTQTFGTIICRDLIKLDLSNPEDSRRLAEISKDKCDKFAEFIIGKLYELDEKRNAA